MHEMPRRGEYRDQEPRRPDAALSGGDVMGIVIALIVLAIIFGGIGLFVAAAKWALIIGVILLIAGLVMGFMGRGRTRV
jgi:hypothetical protein